ncbi:MAG: hypothetical protein RLZZ165_1247 [Bacteroidota bacterium]|jgi:hypothetical protein
MSYLQDTIPKPWPTIFQHSIAVVLQAVAAAVPLILAGTHPGHHLCVHHPPWNRYMPPWSLCIQKPANLPFSAAGGRIAGRIMESLAIGEPVPQGHCGSHGFPVEAVGAARFTPRLLISFLQPNPCLECGRFFLLLSVTLARKLQDAKYKINVLGCSGKVYYHRID